MSAYDEFMKRVHLETPLIKKELAGQVFGVVEVDDLCWWPDTDHSYVLATVKLRSKKYAIVGYEDGIFSLLSSERRDYQMVLDNLQHHPVLELDDEHINVCFAKDRHLLVLHRSTDYQNLKCGWNVVGSGWSGPRAIAKFAEHGVSVDFQEE